MSGINCLFACNHNIKKQCDVPGVDVGLVAATRPTSPYSERIILTNKKIADHKYILKNSKSDIAHIVK